MMSLSEINRKKNYLGFYQGNWCHSTNVDTFFQKYCTIFMSKRIFNVKKILRFLFTCKGQILGTETLRLVAKKVVACCIVIILCRCREEIVQCAIYGFLRVL